MCTFILCCSRKEDNNNRYFWVLVVGSVLSTSHALVYLKLLKSLVQSIMIPIAQMQKLRLKKVRCPRIEQISDKFRIYTRCLPFSQFWHFCFMGQAASSCSVRNMSNLEHIWSVLFLSGWINSLLSSTCSGSVVFRRKSSFLFICVTFVSQGFFDKNNQNLKKTMTKDVFCLSISNSKAESVSCQISLLSVLTSWCSVCFRNGIWEIFKKSI